MVTSGIDSSRYKEACRPAAHVSSGITSNAVIKPHERASFLSLTLSHIFRHHQGEIQTAKTQKEQPNIQGYQAPRSPSTLQQTVQHGKSMPIMRLRKVSSENIRRNRNMSSVVPRKLVRVDSRTRQIRQSTFPQVQLEEISHQRLNSIFCLVLHFVDSSFETFQVLAVVVLWVQA